MQTGAPIPSIEISRLIHSTPTDGDFRLFSKPMAFDMPEDEYERRIGSHHGMEEGQAIFRLFQHFGGSPGGVALELGAGGGAATLGFVASAPSTMHTIITDPSPAFLRIIQQKLARAGLSSTNVTFGTLLGEELNRIPEQSLDLIFLAACLHHVLDYKQFLTDAAASLKPGGLLIFHEPFSEGFLLMAMAVEVMLRFDTKLFVLKAEDREKLRRMLAAMYFQSDRLVPKGDSEDKHCFLADDLLSACWDRFDEVHFLRNQSFASIANLKRVDEISLGSSSCASIIEYLRSFMVNHHLVSDGAIRYYDQHVTPALHHIDRLYRQGDGPTIYATVLCRKSLS